MKITDVDNGYSTYIIIKVVEGIEADIKHGAEFTVALKENGTVWTYGANENGELGNGTNENSNKPVQVINETGADLENIIQIDAEGNSIIALNSNKEVYTWGLCYKEGTAKNINIATKVEGLANIIDVTAKANNYYALDEQGIVYAWGKDYTQITTLQTNNKFVNIDGNLLLGEDGRVYEISDLNTPLKYLSSIYELSEGATHSLFINLDGLVYSYGEGDLGQLGNLEYTKTKYSSVIMSKEGQILTNIKEISAGEKTSMALRRRWESLCLGR